MENTGRKYFCILEDQGRTSSYLSTVKIMLNVKKYRKSLTSTIFLKTVLSAELYQNLLIFMDLLTVQPKTNTQQKLNLWQNNS
jgi:hypothetical protein